MDFKTLKIRLAAFNFSFGGYTYIILLNCILALVFRLLEFLLIAISHHTEYWILAGMVSDVFIFSGILVLLFPAYHMLFKRSKRIANRVFLSLSTVFWTLHVCFLAYFVNEFKPADIFVFQYQLSEVLQTIGSSDINWYLWIPLLFVPGIFILFSRKFIEPMRIPASYLIIITLIVAPVYVFFKIRESGNKLIVHKSLFFYSGTIRYFSGISVNCSHSAKAYQEAFSGPQYTNPEYPFLHKLQENNGISNYFTKSDAAPNVVIIIVEGLGDNLLNRNEAIVMPFLESLRNQSLYWNHFLTNGERSFSALPCITGSLPYGEKGFTFLQKYPRHLNLLHILKRNSYHTAFFYGQGAWMHHKDRFLKMSGVDTIVDKNNFDPRFAKIITGADHYFWGYNDRDLFDQYLEYRKNNPQSRRLEIFFTGTMHPPFEIRYPEHYTLKFDQVARNCKNREEENFLKRYRKYLMAAMFTDDALQSFFVEYKKRPDFKNTIFVITGDHPMSQIPSENALKRYHVPLFIYSPLIKQPATFRQIASHLDIYESLLILLKQNYNVVIPDLSAGIGSILPTDRPASPKIIALMNDNREINDILQDGYFLSEGEKLYAVQDHLELMPVENKQVREKLLNSLKLFQEMNLHACRQDRLLPDSLFFRFSGRRIVQEIHQTKPVSSSGEFTSLAPLSKVPAKGLAVDIETGFYRKADLPAIVFELRNRSDSLLFWQSVQPPAGVYHTDIDLSDVTAESDSLRLHVYLWNKKRVRFTLENFHLFVTGKN